MISPSPGIATPRVMLFDWHGTLVDTLDAMYAAMEDVLPLLDELGLVDRLIPETLCNTVDDARLVRYIRIFRRLPPRVLAERRVSRTDIFNAIFGADSRARDAAHKAYNRCYDKHVGEVRPFQQGVYDYLTFFKRLGLELGVVTNRNRRFLAHELATVDQGRWIGLFDTTVCADDVTAYKPAPDAILAALASLGEAAGKGIWYVGDSYSDMVAAKSAGVTAVFYNSLHWEHSWFDQTFHGNDRFSPDIVVGSFEQLAEVLQEVQAGDANAFALPVQAIRPPAYPAPEPPAPRVEPDWHPAVAELASPRVILFDWHATLVDTMDAMYHAVDDMLPELRKLGLMERMADPEQARSPDDARLIEYVRRFAALHPKIKADRKISRTDIFEVLFGDDEEAKRMAHARFNRHYRNHFGVVRPFEPQLRRLLGALHELPVRLGVITNRDREFFQYEINAVDDMGWAHLFDVQVCGDDTPLRKPHPDQLLKSLQRLGHSPGPDVWYVGDSTTDTVAAKRAGITNVFFNGAQWDLPWLRTIFPGTERYPYKPDVVVNDFSEFWALVLACRDKRVNRTASYEPA